MNTKNATAAFLGVNQKVKNISSVEKHKLITKNGKSPDNWVMFS